MIGQFHPGCPTPSARNPFFLVNRAPLPLVAVRAMSIHDILFLTDRERWVDTYLSLFADQLGRTALDPLYATVLDRAQRQRTR